MAPLLVEQKYTRSGDKFPTEVGIRHTDPEIGLKKPKKEFFEMLLSGN